MPRRKHQTEAPAGDGWRVLGEVRPAGSMPGPPSLGPMVTTWPHLLFRELLAVLVGLIVLTVASVLFMAPLEEAANPTTTPNPAKAPWYFVGLQELLVSFDPWIAGVMIPLVIIFGLCAIPYIDPSRKGEGVYSFKDRPLAFTIFTAGLIGWLALIVVGSWFRGPGWTWAAPWTDAPPPPSTELGWSLPNAFGVPLVLAFFLGGGWAVSRWTRKWPGMGTGQRFVFGFLVLTMAGTAVKIVLRTVFGMKYLVNLPGTGFSI